MRIADGGHLVNNRDTVSTEFSPTKQRPYRMNRKLSPAEQAELVRLYQAGASMLELSRKFESHRHSIARHLARTGIDVRPQKKMTPQLVERAKQLYADGQSLTAIGKQL